MEERAQTALFGGLREDDERTVDAGAPPNPAANEPAADPLAGILAEHGDAGRE
jgi:hypothetical protein